MTQNTSSAVMQQRREPSDSLDDFPTPPWAGRALCEAIGGKAELCRLDAWEPACNRGFLARALNDYFRSVTCSDLGEYGFAAGGFDFLDGSPIGFVPDWIITNPPFRLAQPFVDRAFALSRIGTAMLVRTAFLESVGRYEELFSLYPPTSILQFTERVPMVRGRCDPTASTATAYCWVVWDKLSKSEATEFRWIPPCRKRLERPGDYEAPRSLQESAA